MKSYDISVMISEATPSWPGDSGPQLTRIQKLDEGDGANVTQVNMCAHTATHVDAPLHFLKKGKSVEKLSLDVLVGRAQVIEHTGEHHLGTTDFASLEEGIERVLIKTSNSALWSNPTFHKDYIAVAAEGAQYLVDRGIKLVGIDYLSIAPFETLVPPHEILLGAEVVVVEGLDLSEVEPGIYQLCCLPLKLSGADGAPARTILMPLGA